MQFIRNTCLYLALVMVAIVMVTPLLWLLCAAFKAHDDFHTYTFLPIDWPEWTDHYFSRPWDYFREADYRFTLSNFTSLFEEIPFLRFMINSFFVASTTTLVQLFFSTLGGFALAKYEFKAKRLIMLIMLGTMMLPGELLLAPLYELIFHFNLMDTYAGLIVPGMVSVFGMFLFRQAMLQIPDELLQAGRIDGCSEFRLYWDIALPITRPMIGAFCLIAFMASWNSFIWPQIILQTTDRYTLTIGVNQMVGVYKQDYGALMAGTLLSITPVVILFFMLQKEFIAGLTSGAVKG